MVNNSKIENTDNVISSNIESNVNFNNDNKGRTKVTEIDVSKIPPRTLVELLTINGQSHLLESLKNCPEEKRDDFIEQIDKIDWGALKNIFTPLDMSKAHIKMSNVLSLSEREKLKDNLENIGEECYKAGQVGVLLVAGGQGTRLGYNGPKGCFQTLKSSKKTLYQIHAEKILFASKKYGEQIPFLVMTSPDTDIETRTFFKENNYFGLNKDMVFFFCQSVTATCSLTGKALLKNEGELLRNPDGHGGCYTAFMRSGALEFLENHGIKALVYIQVDNILAPIDDPILVGLLKSKDSDLITKVLKKASPKEKVGHLVSVNGKDQIVEYVDVTQEQLSMVNDNGELVFNWGSPAMHAFSVDFFRRLKNQQVNLPFHQSKKIVKAYVDGVIQDVEAYKHEKFIFDLLPLANNHMGLEIKREDEFSPIKNASGVDSVDTALELYSNRNKRWLAQVGVSEKVLDSSNYVEIDTMYAPTIEDFKSNWNDHHNMLTGEDGDILLNN